MNKKPDVLDTFSKIMFFSSWKTANPSEENKKKREEDIAFVESELERLVKIDYINSLSKDTEPMRALEELENGLMGHCKSSYLKDNPKELEGILNVYKGMFNKVRKYLQTLEAARKWWPQLEYVVETDNYNEYLDTDENHPNDNMSEEEYELLKEFLK